MLNDTEIFRSLYQTEIASGMVLTPLNKTLSQQKEKQKKKLWKNFFHKRKINKNSKPIERGRPQECVFSKLNFLNFPLKKMTKATNIPNFHA